MKIRIGNGSLEIDTEMNYLGFSFMIVRTLTVPCPADYIIKKIQNSLFK